MSEEERQTYAELIEEIISKQLKPFIILASVLITIFGLIAVPIASQVLLITKDQAQFDVRLSEKADKTELKKYLPTQDAIDINRVRDAYYRDIFVLNPNSTTDSTNYNLVLKTLFGANARSSSQENKIN